MVTNMGPLHDKLQKALQERFGCFVSLFSHGHLALEAALETIPESRGEVITTPFTFASTVHAIVRKGLTPVFCDVLQGDGTLNPECIEKLIGKNTVAILPVHVYGNPCDVKSIGEIASRHSIPVIYDAAHAFDVIYEGRPLVTYGDASVLSFHATKVFSTIEGGAICYDKAGYTSCFDSCKNFGIKDEETCVYPGGNAKLNEFSAAMGICNLRHLEDERKARRKARKLYMEALEGKIQPLSPRAGTEPNHAYFPVLFRSQEERDKVYFALRKNDIYPRKYFYPLVSQFDCYKKSDFKGILDTPVAENISSRGLCLPLYPDVPVERIISILIQLN